jgi:IS30 family transposase
MGFLRSRRPTSGSVGRWASRYMRLDAASAREVARHGGRPVYRASEADHQAWKSALRPKAYLLARHRRLRLIVASKNPELVATKVNVYFSDPQSPGSAAPTKTPTGCHDYFPRKTDLSGYSQADLDKVARQLNQRPRKTLGFESPASKLHASVASTRWDRLTLQALQLSAWSSPSDGASALPTSTSNITRLPV